MFPGVYYRNFYIIYLVFSGVYHSPPVCFTFQDGVVRAKLREVLANNADVHYADSVASSEAIAMVPVLSFPDYSTTLCFVASM
jgi:hypothetical protein